MGMKISSLYMMIEREKVLYFSLYTWNWISCWIDAFHTERREEAVIFHYENGRKPFITKKTSEDGSVA